MGGLCGRRPPPGLHLLRVHRHDGAQGGAAMRARAQAGGHTAPRARSWGCPARRSGSRAPPAPRPWAAQTRQRRPQATHQSRSSCRSLAFISATRASSTCDAVVEGRRGGSAGRAGPARLPRRSAPASSFPARPPAASPPACQQPPASSFPARPPAASPPACQQPPARPHAARPPASRPPTSALRSGARSGERSTERRSPGLGPRCRSQLLLCHAGVSAGERSTSNRTLLRGLYAPVPPPAPARAVSGAAAAASQLLRPPTSGVSRAELGRRLPLGGRLPPLPPLRAGVTSHSSCSTRREGVASHADRPRPRSSPPPRPSSRRRSRSSRRRSSLLQRRARRIRVQETVRRLAWQPRQRKL